MLFVATPFAGPVHVAAWEGDIKGVKAQLVASTDVNVRDENGEPALLCSF